MSHPTTKPVKSALGRSVRPGILKYSVAWFLGALSALFIAAPFVDRLPTAQILEPLLFTVVLTFAVLAVGGRRHVLHVATMLVIPTLTLKWLTHLMPGLVPPEAFYLGAAAFITYVTTHLMLFVLRAKRVNSEVLCAGIAVYLLISLLWASFYLILVRFEPNAFQFTVGPPKSGRFEGFNVLYFSLVALNTSAFGDIVPATPLARMVAMVETTVGVFYLAVLISRLVSLYAPQTRETP